MHSYLCCSLPNTITSLLMEMLLPSKEDQQMAEWENIIASHRLSFLWEFPGVSKLVFEGGDIRAEFKA